MTKDTRIRRLAQHFADTETRSIRYLRPLRLQE